MHFLKFKIIFKLIVTSIIYLAVFTAICKCDTQLQFTNEQSCSSKKSLSQTSRSLFSNSEDIFEEKDLTFGLDTEFEYSSLNWSDNSARKNLLTNSILDAYWVGLSPNIEYAVSKDWTLDASIYASLAGDSGLSISDSAAYEGFLFLADKLTKSFSLSGGLDITNDIDGGKDILPLIGFDWQISDIHHLSLGVDVNWPALSYEYKYSDEIRFLMQASYQDREYRISNINNSKAIFYDTSLPLTVGTQWKVTPDLSFTVNIGTELYRNIKIKRNSDNISSSENLKGSPLLMFTADFGL